MAKKLTQLAAAASLVGTEAVEVSQLSATIKITAATLSALASDNSFNDSGNGFVTAGFAVGDQVNVAGFTGNTVNNIYSATITVLTAGKMTIGGTDGDVIVDDAAGESVTITKWLSRRTTATALATGTTGIEFKSLTFTSDTGSTADSDPGNGLFKWNNATQASATFIYVDNQTQDAVVITTFFSKLFPGGFLYLQQYDDSTKWQVWRITSIASATGYYKFGVSLMAASASAIADDKVVLCHFENGQRWEYSIACSDETTAITVGTAKATFRMPAAVKLTDIHASVNTAPTGATIIIDVNESGATIMTTNKLSIDTSEKTSTTAATPPGITDADLADDAEITIDFDQVGSTVAGAGVKVTFIGYYA